MLQLCRVSKRLIFSLVLGLLVVGNGLFVPEVKAGCTNYEDYLHWVNTIELVIGNPGAIEVQNDLAFISINIAGPDLLLIYDISNESQPVFLSSLSFPGILRELTAFGNILAVSSSGVDVDFGLSLVDVSDPGNPQIIGTALAGVGCNDVKIVESTAFLISDQLDSFYAVGISNPALPDSFAAVSLPAAPQDKFAVHNGFAYLSCYSSGVLTMDISSPETPSITSIVEIPDRFASYLTVHDNMLYVASRGNYDASGLHRFSLSNPANPNLVASFHGYGYEGTYYPHIAAAAGVCYLSASTGGVQMVDISNTTMTLIGSIIYPGGSVRGLAAIGNNLYDLRDDVGNSPYAKIVTTSVSSPSPMEPIGSIATAGDAQKVVIPATRDNLAYVVVGTGGMEIINIDDPGNPYLVGSVDTPGNAVDITVSGNRAYIADSEEGMCVIDITIPSAPTILHTVTTTGTALNLSVVDTVAYLADGFSGLHLINISESSPPAIISSLDTDGFAQGVDINGSLCYVADGSEGLKVCDVSDPENPWIIGGVKNRDLSGAMKVNSRGNYVYVTDEASGLLVVDVSDPENPTVAGTSETESAAQDVNLLGIFAFVADSGSGVKVIDIEDPNNPSIVGNMNIPTAAKSVFANENYAYVAAGSGGLQICPTQCGFNQTAIADFITDIDEAMYPITVQFTDTSLGYGLDYTWDFGDGMGSSTETNPVYTFDSPGAYTVTLTITNGVNQDVTSKVVSALTEPPTITSITDVPNDQGGFVYVKFFRCADDTDGPGKSEMYSVQRLDGSDWITVNTTVAFGESYYNVLVNTQGDGAENWTTQYRVVGSMDEGIWISSLVDGFSEDNIAPAIPQNVLWVGANRLGWDQVPDPDFAYYQIYSSPTSSFSEAVSQGVTTDTEYTVENGTNPWFFVAAFDDAGLEGSPSSALGLTTGIPTLPGELVLYPAVPNPFNPFTRIQFSLTKPGFTNLVIYDIAGRLVKTLAMENMAAGNHEVVWQGLNNAGHGVSSGTYFYRLEAEGEILTRRMILIK